MPDTCKPNMGISFTLAFLVLLKTKPGLTAKNLTIPCLLANRIIQAERLDFKYF